ncbi:N-formylglutamate deformylase [Actibacterium sp. D379-3]
MIPVEVTEGDSAVVLGMPHTGTHVPDTILDTFNQTGRALADTDWNIDRLYEGLLPGATRVRATFHRYVIDANRAPSGDSLYPGQNTTGLCPLTDFDGRPIHADGRAPDADEIARRRDALHAPYHAALQAQLDRVRDRHGTAILFDCHSIRSRIPFLFDDTLPDLNIGTNNGTTCAAAIEQATAATCRAASGFSSVTNGRFRGGWTTRQYGRPGLGQHAIQLEIAQATYMDEAPPWTFRKDKAARLRPVLATLLAQLDMIARTGLKERP